MQAVSEGRLEFLPATRTPRYDSKIFSQLWWRALRERKGLVVVHPLGKNAIVRVDIEPTGSHLSPEQDSRVHAVCDAYFRQHDCFKGQIWLWEITYFALWQMRVRLEDVDSFVADVQAAIGAGEAASW